MNERAKHELWTRVVQRLPPAAITWLRLIGLLPATRAQLQEPSVDAPQTQEDRDYLAMMYEEHAEHARQHEILRGGATGFFIALIAGLLAAAVGEGQPNKDAIVGLVICAVSIIGAILNTTHYERYLLHIDIMKGFRRSLEAGLTTKSLASINLSFRNWHEYRYVRELKLHKLYVGIYLVTFWIGVMIVASGLLS